MDDPWDVKSVRQSGQYISCMKINGVPLLPPVLSMQCRKEMQYYKLLAKEVENRINLLKPLVPGDESDTSEEIPDLPEIHEHEKIYELPPNEVQAGFDINIKKITAISPDSSVANPLISTANSPDNSSSSHKHDLLSSPKLVIDLSMSINDTGKNSLETVKRIQQTSIELPERDCDTKDVVDKSKPTSPEVLNFSLSLDKHAISKTFPELCLKGGPSSISGKSFTGSLVDIHSESVKQNVDVPRLVRQRSYTVLKPSPMLLAHLEVESMNMGIDVSSISMSESRHRLKHSPSKRRSWDLETAKSKWSSMAVELKNTTDKSVKSSNSKIFKSDMRKPAKNQYLRARSVGSDKIRSPYLNTKISSKSAPYSRTNRSISPTSNLSSTTITKELVSQSLISKISQQSPKKNGLNASQNKSLVHSPPNSKPKTPISESIDPASRVRELYERIQNQQLVQMASLVEKQKREQQLLQQVFEEQNSLLYKQLKTICPKSPIEAKEAWSDNSPDSKESGPVSLSQLIQPKTPETPDMTLSSTLTDTKNYINYCDQILKRSRDLSDSLKKSQTSANMSQKSKLEGSLTRTHSPITTDPKKSTPRRKIVYDTSSSEREVDPMLTDRTNDTMNDVNVTFSTDESTNEPFISNNNTILNHNEIAVKTNGLGADDTLRSMMECLQSSLSKGSSNKRNRSPTPQERDAATKIVAHAKGYLTRRLIQTERVQATVQTIKDALLCALQLHQDREGIRGADVDLHRRLIQQITAACYTLHDTLVASSPAQRCAVLAADRARRAQRTARATPTRSGQSRSQDLMTQSHSGAFPARGKRPSLSSNMTQSHHDTFSESRSPLARRCFSPRRRPWR